MGVLGLKIFGEKNIVLAGIICILLLLPVFAGVADFSPKKNILLVNSLNYEDVIAASVYAAQNDYIYTFILTPTHGKYWIEVLGESSDNIQYYESGKPARATMGDEIRKLSKQNIIAHSSSNLAHDFAKLSNSNFVVVVGDEVAAEAISAASYAAIKGSLYFTDKQSADADVTQLANDGKKVLVYGSIADSISEQMRDSVEIINSGSIYLDNLHLLELYSETKNPSQVLLASGKTFESNMVSKDYPIAIVGRTEPAEGLFGWILSSGVKGGLVFSGDADISGSVASIKKETGLPVFAKLGQGFVGDSQVQPLAVLSVPSKDVMLKVSSVAYKNCGFELEITNIGVVDAYVRATASLPDGRLGSTESLKLASGESKKLFVNLEYLGSSKVIDEAMFMIYSGSDSFVVESIDVITFNNIKVESTTPSMSILTGYVDDVDAATYTREQGGMVFSAVIALVLMLVAAYLFMHHKKGGSHVVLERGSHHHKTHKKRGRH